MRFPVAFLAVTFVSATDPCKELCASDGPEICTGGSFNKRGVCHRYLFVGNPTNGVYCYHTAETVASCPSNGVPVSVEDVPSLLARASTTTTEASTSTEEATTSEPETTTEEVTTEEMTTETTTEEETTESTTETTTDEVSTETTTDEVSSETTTDEIRRAAFGIYPIRPRSSWITDEGDLMEFYRDNEIPEGDLVLYMFDALSSSYSFETVGDAIERLVTEYRSRNTESTVWFVYDDGGNLDAEALRDFMGTFRAFLGSVADRDALGSLGLMVNTEEMNSSDLATVIDEEYSTIRNANTLLGLSIYTYETDNLEVGLDHADMVLVAIEGDDALSISDSAQAFLNENEGVVGDSIGSQASLGFRVRNSINQSAQEIAEALFERVHPMTPLVKPRTVMTVYNWEQWGRL